MIETLAALPLVAGMVVGFLGSPHCVAMCGGIAGALSVALPPERRCGPAAVAHHAAYSAGRIASYALAGALAGALGIAFARLLGDSGVIALRTAAAALLVALGLSLAGWWRGLARLEALGARLWRRIAPLAARLRPGRSPLGAFALGTLWGWLPCGLVYSALALAAATGSAAGGALLMAGFGLGTLPALLATGVLAQRLGTVASRIANRRVAGAMLIVFGLWTFLGSSQPPTCH